MILILLVFTGACTPGCLKIVQQSGTGATSGLPSQVTADKGGSVPDGMEVPVSGSVSPHLSSPDVVIAALPDLPPDPYPVQHAVNINVSPDLSRHKKAADFTQTYILRGNSTGLIVNATVLKGPLWIYFDVKPLYDCLDDPDSCRGTVTKSISRPYFTLTVRDNQTRGIIAEDGYGGIYSSQKTNRTIKIFGEGRYHLTLTGNSVDVTLSIATGSASTVPAAQPSDTTSPHVTMIPSEILQRIREGG